MKTAMKYKALWHLPDAPSESPKGLVAWPAKYPPGPATDKQLKMAKPMINWFLGLLRSTYCKLDRPTATINPKSAQ